MKQFLLLRMKLLSFLKTHKIQIILGIILLAAAFFRLYRISDYLTFLGDEGRDMVIAKGILEGHFTLLGPRASAGDFYTGPIYYYMMAPFVWLFHYDPVGPAVMVALLSVATVWLIYFIGKKFFHIYAVLLACSLYAVSPLVITYAQFSWNPNPMPFFTLLLLYLLYKAVKQQSCKLFILSGLLYGLVLQLHYIETFTGVIILLFVILGNYVLKLKQSFLALGKHYLEILLGFLLGLSPFLLFEVRHDFLNSKSILHFIFYGDSHAANLTHIPFLQTISDVFFRLFGYLIFSFPAPKVTPHLPQIVAVIFAAVVVLITFIALYCLRFMKDKLLLLLIVLWLVVGVGLFGFYHKPIYDYYLAFMFPLPFLIFANFFSVFVESKKFQPILKSIVVIIFISAFIYALVRSPLQYPPNNQKGQMKSIADFVISKTDNQPFNFALLTKGNSDDAYRYFMDIDGHKAVPIDNQIDDPKRTTVTNQLLVVCEDLSCKPLGNPLFNVAAFGRAKIAGEWNYSYVKVYRLVHY
ncbi:MAG TPA: glycosyltransferase family 39 protein [Patescibacteria group bacterium]|nr:glycosyltransferase family 39 protein [Patescibacteria group bacterium]